MNRPPLILIDDHEKRRAVLGRGLTAVDHEVVKAASVTEGLRFARGLEGAVIVISASVAADELTPEKRERLSRAAAAEGRTVVLLGEPQLGFDNDDVVVLRVAELEVQELVGRLHLILIGRELGIEVDSRGEALVGDLAIHPWLAIAQGLGAVRASGRIELEEGILELERGKPRRMEAGRARNEKAFCRLARLSTGPFRIVIELPSAAESPPGGPELQEWIGAAIEDSLGEFPDPRLHVEIELGPDFFNQELSLLAQEIVRAAQKGVVLGTLLDQLEEVNDGAIVEELLRLADRGIAILREPPTSARIITDSTSDLPAHIAREQGIEVVPLGVRFGESTFTDGVDLAAGRFYGLLTERSEHPSTEPPSVADFAERYRAVLERSDVVSLHLSAKLSATAANARQAASEVVPGIDRTAARVEVVDSSSVSMGLGMLALFAARMAASGASAPMIGERLASISRRLHLLFVVDTLDFLARGGRIGTARAFVGKLLGIRPILGVEGGEVVAVERVRGGRAAQDRLLALISERLLPERPIVAAIGHSNAPVWADRLKRRVAERFTVAGAMVGEIGPVVGTHVGPGTVGLAVFQPEPEEAESLGIGRTGAAI